MGINGTGGANTNLSGKAFENKNDFATAVKNNLSNKYSLSKHSFKPANQPNNNYSYDLWSKTTGKQVGIITKQFQFYNVLADLGIHNANSSHWNPDGAFFNFTDDSVYIIEMKYQNEPGSNDEKVLDSPIKRRLYQTDFNQVSGEPKPTVSFCVMLNSNWWLKKATGRQRTSNYKKYQDYFNALRDDGVKIFFDNYNFNWFGL